MSRYWSIRFSRKKQKDKSHIRKIWRFSGKKKGEKRLTSEGPNQLSSTSLCQLASPFTNIYFYYQNDFDISVFTINCRCIFLNHTVLSNEIKWKQIKRMIHFRRTSSWQTPCSWQCCENISYYWYFSLTKDHESIQLTHYCPHQLFLSSLPASGLTCQGWKISQSWFDRHSFCCCCNTTFILRFLKHPCTGNYGIWWE